MHKAHNTVKTHHGVHAMKKAAHKHMVKHEVGNAKEMPKLRPNKKGQY